MDDSELQVECPHCGAVFAVADGPAGRQATCPVCRGAVKVLDVQEEPKATATAATAEGEQEQEHEKVQDYFVARSAENLVSANAGYCLVCCAGEEKLNPLEVTPVLRTIAGQAQRDAAHQVTHGMGILAEGLVPDTALNMVGALKAKGVQAFAVPADKAPQPVDKVRFYGIYDVDERSLHVQVDPQGTVRALGWDSVVAGVTTKERFSAHGTPGFEMDLDPSGGGMPRIVTHQARRSMADEPPLTLSLVLRDNQGRLHVLAVTPQHVRYAYLGERLQNNHNTNFQLFLTDVAKRAQGAFFPASYMRVAAGNQLALREPVGRLEYDNYLRWAVCCAVARGGQPGHRED